MGIFKVVGISPMAGWINKWFDYLIDLTHLPLNKMAAILAGNNFKCIFLNGNDKTPDSNFTEICSRESN